MGASKINPKNNKEMFNAVGDTYGLFANNKDRWIMDMIPRTDGRPPFTGMFYQLSVRVNLACFIAS
jgi:hypothetical protein